MDKVFEQMQLFSKELIEFNLSLKRSMAILDQHHREIDPIWNAQDDNFRREYDKQWDPLYEGMQNYIKKEAPRYVEFLQIKLHSLRKYLNR